MSKNSVAALTICAFVLMFATTTSAAYVSPTGTSEIVCPQNGGGEGLALLPADAWGWFGENSGQDDKWRSEFGVELIKPEFKIKYKSGGEQTSKSMVYTLPLGSLAYKLNDEVTFKLIIRNPFRLGAAFEKDREQLGFDTQSLLSLTTIAVLTDVKLTEDLHVSFGPIFGYCQEKWHAPFDFDRHPLPILTDSRASGLSEPALELAIFYDVSDRVKLAFQYVSPITVDLRGRTLISLGLFDIRDHFKSQLVFPQTFTWVCTVQATEKLRLSGDVFFWNYSTTPNSQVLTYEHLPLIKGLAVGAEDAFGIHVGANYVVNEKLQLRFGVGWLSQSVPDKRLDTLTFDVPGWDATGGATVKINNSLSLNGVLTYSWGESKSHNGDKLSTGILTGGVSFSWKF